MNSEKVIQTEVEVETPDAPGTLTRRSLLTYAVQAPVLTVAAGFGANLVTPGTANAALPLTPPDTVDYYDVGDSLVQTALPTMPLVKVTITAKGRVELQLPRLEAGQGISTSVAIMLADELGVPVSLIDIPAADASPELIFNQISGGSAAVRCFDAGMPLIAAVLRTKLLLAGASLLGTSTSSLSIRGDAVVSADGRSASLASLSASASGIALPSTLIGRPAGQPRVIGKPQRRIDGLDIVTGKKKFTMDQDVPNARPAMVRMPTQMNGKVLGVGPESIARAKAAFPNIKVIVIPTGGTIVKIPPGVAVVADTFGEAWAAANMLDIVCGDGPMAGLSDETIKARLKRNLLPLGVPPLGALSVGGDFEWLAATHAPLEVECCIADVRPDRAEFWAGLQCPIISQQSVASDLGLPISKVKTHVIPSGGSFGRRLFWDPMQIAAQVSKLAGEPVKLMYHRSDDVRHTRLRPPQVHRVAANILLGQVVSYKQTVAAVRLDARHGYGEPITAIGGSLPPAVAQTVGNLAYEQVFFKTMVASPYNFGVSSKVLVPVAIDMNTVSYRSVHIQPARTIEEIVVDEIAHKMGRDPYEFRMSFLRLPRARAVLRTVAEKGNWGRKMPAGTAQGIAVHQESRSFTAVLVEMDCTNPADPKVTKAVIAIDVGKTINPLGVENQVMGAFAEALSLTVRTGLNFVNGLPLQSSYTDYNFAKLKDYPKQIEVHITPDAGQGVGGLGEVGLSAASGAIANAYARAMRLKEKGTPIRKFPLVPKVLTPETATVKPGKLAEPVFIPL